MVPLTPEQIAALRAIRMALPATHIIVVGALALGHLTTIDYRHTEDLDLAVAMKVDDFPGPLGTIVGWRRHPVREHLFITDRAIEIDVLPAGPDAVASGFIEWQSGHRMSLVGFDLAFRHSQSVRVEEDLWLDVPDACVLALLKMRAWLDRPYEREKDLEDLGYLLCRYWDDNDERHWSDAAIASGLDFDLHSAFALGTDLRGVCSPAHLDHVREFLARVPRTTLASVGPSRWKYDEVHLERVIAALEQGLRG